MTTPQVLKGFRDYLPQDAAARRQIIAKIAESFERFGFSALETPALEAAEVLLGNIGEDEKLIYKFKDLGDRDVALRYDLTVPLARVVANYPELSKPFKRYQIANVWRAENPQKGRFREFTQCDVDVIGSDSVLAEAEVIAALATAFASLAIGEVIVKFNNRLIVDEVLTQLKFNEDQIVIFLRAIDKLDKIGEDKVSAILSEQGVSIDLAEYRKLMRETAAKFVEQFTKLLSGFGITNIQFDPTLARGLAYYTGLVFEFTLQAKPEFGSIGGGGRYDNLIGQFTGKNISAVGGSIGLDRLYAALTDAGTISPQSSAEVIIFNLDEKLIPQYLSLAKNLRNAGLNTEIYYESVKLDKQFKYAENKNIQVAVIMGEDEASNKQVNLKNLKDKTQVTVNLSDLSVRIKSML